MVDYLAMPVEATIFMHLGVTKGMLEQARSDPKAAVYLTTILADIFKDSVETMLRDPQLYLTKQLAMMQEKLS